MLRGVESGSDGCMKGSGASKRKESDEVHMFSFACLLFSLSLLVVMIVGGHSK